MQPLAAGSSHGIDHAPVRLSEHLLACRLRKEASIATDTLFRAAQGRAGSGDVQAADVAAALFAAGKAANDAGDFAVAEKMFQSGFLVMPRVRASAAPRARPDFGSPDLCPPLSRLSSPLEVEPPVFSGQHAAQARQAPCGTGGVQARA